MARNTTLFSNYCDDQETLMVDYSVIPSGLQMGWINSPAYFGIGTNSVPEILRRI